MADVRPVSTVVADIVENIEDIVGAEVRLASAEIQAKALRASRAGSLIASGLGLFLYAFGLLIAAAVLLLSRVIDAWIATLMVCALVAAAAAVLVTIGFQRWKRLRLAPEKTARSVKENVSWMKAQVR